MKERAVRSKQLSERGTVALIFSVGIVAIFGIAALVIDLGNARQTERKVQSAADAGALAGVQDLPVSGTDADLAAAARASAADYALASLRLDMSATTCPAGGSDRVCYADGSRLLQVISPVNGNAQKVRVELCEQTETVFAKVFTNLSPNVCKSAEAEVTQNLAAAPAVLATDPSACGAINTHGNGDIIATGGAIQVNSTCNSALTQEGSSSELISDTCVCVVGGTNLEHPGNVLPVARTGAAPVANPYENVPTSVAQPATAGSVSGKTYSPGYFNSQISMSSGTYTFLPGIYYLKAGLKVEGGVTIKAEGVLFYIAGGGFNIGSGPHTIRISGLADDNPSDDDPDGPYDGLAIYQSPTNTTTFNYGDDAHAGNRVGNQCEVSATSGIAGGVYIPNALMHIRGNNSRFCTTLPIVAKQIEVEEWSTLGGTGGADAATATKTIALVD